jgi:hypothetical protein
MKSLKRSAWFLGFTAALLLFAACGKSTAIGDLPVYKGATELKPDDSRIGATLAKNTQQDAAMRQALGVGGQTVQRGFSLPADATWDSVSDFYEKELKASGWTSGLGGLAGGFANLNAVMNTANQASDMMKTMIFTKGKQNLTVLMMTDPIKRTDKTLILSLSTR